MEAKHGGLQSNYDSPKCTCIIDTEQPLHHGVNSHHSETIIFLELVVLLVCKGPMWCQRPLWFSKKKAYGFISSTTGSSEVQDGLDKARRRRAAFVVKAVDGDLREMGSFPAFTTNRVWCRINCLYILSF